MKKINLKNKKAIVAMLLTATLGVGSAYSIAYLTDAETATNTFTAGDVKTELEEPNWDPTKATDMVPYQVVAKDPQIENSGENDEIVFMRVTVPVERVTQVEENGTKGTTASQEIVYLQKSGTSQGTHANAFNTTNWIELTSKETNTDYATVDANGRGTRTYVFGYKTKLAKGQKTDALFDQIQLKNVVERELTSQAGYDIKVEAFAIQADNVLRNGTKIDTTGALNLADLTYIYEAYANQNDGTPRNAAQGEKNLSGTANE